MTTLADLLRSVVEAALNLGGTRNDMIQMRWERSVKPSDETLRVPARAFLHVYSALGTFRDDSHIAAWRDHYEGLTGQEWETLAYLYDEKASTADQLQEKLTFRRYEVGDYAAALKSVEARGWVSDSGGFPSSLIRQMSPW